IFDALLPLGALTRQGMAVSLAHHAGKGERPIGDAPRGSTALLGHVDISIEMRQPGGNPLTRRRRLAALSRCDETPRQLLIELNAEATEYLAVADEIVDDFLANWDQVRDVHAEAPQKLTRLDILDEWPDDFEKPGRATLWRWLARAVEMQQVA